MITFNNYKQICQLMRFKRVKGCFIMALVQVNFISQSLKRTVSMNVILPVDKFLFKGNCQPVKEYKTLYLLHGLLGNYTDWVTRTRIQEWQKQRT